MKHSDLVSQRKRRGQLVGEEDIPPLTKSAAGKRNKNSPWRKGPMVNYKKK